MNTTSQRKRTRAKCPHPLTHAPTATTTSWLAGWRLATDCAIATTACSLQSTRGPPGYQLLSTARAANEESVPEPVFRCRLRRGNPTAAWERLLKRVCPSARLRCATFARASGCDGWVGLDWMGRGLAWLVLLVTITYLLTYYRLPACMHGNWT
jgi:hypothetical protein